LFISGAEPTEYLHVPGVALVRVHGPFAREQMKGRNLESHTSRDGLRMAGRSPSWDFLTAAVRRRFTSHPQTVGWAGVAPHGAPLTVRDLGTQDIYALDVEWPQRTHAYTQLHPQSCSHKFRINAGLHTDKCSTWQLNVNRSWRRRDRRDIRHHDTARLRSHGHRNEFSSDLRASPRGTVPILVPPLEYLVRVHSVFTSHSCKSMRQVQTSPRLCGAFLQQYALAASRNHQSRQLLSSRSQRHRRADHAVCLYGGKRTHIEDATGSGLLALFRKPLWTHSPGIRTTYPRSWKLWQSQGRDQAIACLRESVRRRSAARTPRAESG
jgi:hypothetical protein